MGSFRHLPQEEEPLLGDSPRYQYSSSLGAKPDETLGDARLDGAVQPEDARIGRNLGVFSTVLLILARVVGSGIFATPGVIVDTVGSPGAALLLWIVGGLIAACGLAIHMEFGTMLPRSGGEKVYLEFVYRRPKYLCSVLYVVYAILLGISASNCIVCAEYLLYAANIPVNPWNLRLIALGIITSITVIHGCFLTAGIRVQNTLGAMKLLPVLVIIVSGVAVLFGGTNVPRSGTFDNLFAGTKPLGSAWPSAQLQIVFSYAGFQNANNVLNEVRDPVRTLKFAGPLSWLIVISLYILGNLAYFAVLTREEITSTGTTVAAIFFTKLYGETVGRRILPLFVAMSAMGNVMTVTFTMSRVNQEIARQGLLPWSKFWASNAPFGAPLPALILHWLPTATVILVPPPGDAFNFVVNLAAYPSQVYSFLTVVGLFYLRFARPDIKRPFRAWWTASLLQLCISLYLVITPWVPQKGDKENRNFWRDGYAITGLAVHIIGLLYWGIWFKFLPWWKGKQIVEEQVVLRDGLTVQKLSLAYKAP